MIRGAILAGGELRQGSRSAITHSRIGHTVQIATASKWRHPWFTSLYWEGSTQRWVAAIKPGFVNGHAPIFRESVADPKTGTKSLVSTLLYNNPAITLPWRNVGWDGPGELVPAFFQNLGVASAPSISTGDAQATASSLLAPPPKGNRLLRACDLVLHQPRVALTSQVTILPGLETGMSNVTQTLSLRSPASNDALQILSLAKWDPNAAYDQGIDPLTGVYDEPAYDEIRIATAYLLSGTDAEPWTDGVDVTWQPYVAHSLFWNLNYATPQFHVVNPNPQYGFITPLAGGAGQLVINALTSSLNDLTDNALNVIQANSMAGSFWAATAGGSDSAFPAVPAPTPAGATGLDKDGRLQAQRLAAMTAQKSIKLDPAFPYHSPAFPISLLT